jgi:teichuronic acid exporter
MADSLKSKTLHALFWSFLGSVGLQGVRFIVGIVLARLLFPEQFGLIGMLTIFMAVEQAFFNGGFGVALIQKRDVTPTDTCSSFTWVRER